MTDYSATLTITIPLSQQETGKRISRALDADVGGAGAFNTYLDADMQPCDLEQAVYTTYSSPCSQELAASMPYLLANPGMLQGMVAQDYAARWAEFGVPTVAEIEVFCGLVLNSNTL